MKLLIISLLTLFTGTVTGYGGSKLVDDKYQVFESYLAQSNHNNGQNSNMVLGESEESLVGKEVSNGRDNIVENIISPTATEDLSNIIPSATREPSSAITITMSVTPTPTVVFTPTPTNIPPSASEEVNGFIEKYAAHYSVDPHILRHIAVCESSFNSQAVNRNYVGLYQFSPHTWKVNRQEMGEDTSLELRFSAEESVKTAAYMLSVGKRRSWPVC